MAGRGGYRAPAKPASVSGPGVYSQRTDGGKGQAIQRLPNPGYGESKDFQEIQRGATMAQSQPPQAGLPAELPPTQRESRVIPLTADTQYPHEPVTAGVNIGPGPGREVLGLPDQAVSQYRTAYDLFTALASNPQASPAIKYLAERIGQVF